jgi:hypothetical protein
VGRVRRREMEMLLGRVEAVEAGGWPLFRHYWEKNGYIYHGDNIVASHASPLIDPNAFLSFARLAARGKPSKDPILKWVRRYGLIEEDPWEEYHRHKVHYLISLEQEPMSVEFFQEEACSAYKLLDLFELSRGKAVRDGKVVDELRRRTTVEQFENPPQLGGGRLGAVYVDGLFSWLAGPEEVMTDSKLFTYCRHAIHTAIEPYLRGMRFVFGLHGKLNLRCPDLLSAMYYQFAALVDGRRPTAICPSCNQVFEQKRRDKRFCNDACRVAAKRKREREQAANGTRGRD